MGQPSKFMLFIFTFNTLLGTFIVAKTKTFSICFHLTLWTFNANSIYMFLLLIADFMVLYVPKMKKKGESLGKFVRDKIAPVVNSYSYMVAVTYWSLVLLSPIVGKPLMKMGKTKIKKVRGIYIHGINTLMVVLDIIYNNHKKLHFEKLTALIITVIYFIYASIIIYVKYAYKRYAYPFMRVDTFMELMPFILILYGCILGGYLFHIYLTKVNEKTLEKGIKQGVDELTDKLKKNM